MARITATCELPECERPVVAKHLCGSHYRQHRTAVRDGDYSYPRCAHPGCGRSAWGSGYCDSHKHGALERGIIGVKCAVEGCERSRRGSGLCARHWSRAKAYGLTASQLGELEGRPCQVCGAEGVAIDHNHRTGAVRGVLCDRCNHAIGHGGDDPVRLRELADYLELPPYYIPEGETT